MVCGWLDARDDSIRSVLASWIEDFFYKALDWVLENATQMVSSSKAPEPKPVAARAPARGDSFVPRQLTKRGAGNVVTEDISSWTSDASNAARRKREVRKSESLDS